MALNVNRNLPRQGNVPGIQQLSERRINPIAEVFEDLATESTVELIVYENFLDLNPQVREFPNLGPNDAVFSNEIRINADTGSNSINNRRSINRRISRRFY